MESLAVTTDCWASKKNDPYISLILHFIDSQFYLHRWTPFVNNFTVKHTGMSPNAKLEDLIGTFDLPEEIPIWSVNDKYI